MTIIMAGVNNKKLWPALISKKFKCAILRGHNIKLSITYASLLSILLVPSSLVHNNYTPFEGNRYGQQEITLSI